MQGYFAIVTLTLMILMVLIRVFLLRKMGIHAMKFGHMDKRDFLIVPFVLLFFYLVLSSALHLPTLGTVLFQSEVIGWIGVASCILGLLLFFLSLVSFGKSFRVGIDDENPGKLITTGVFAISRNPIYTAFGFILVGIFLIFLNWAL